MSSIDHQSYYDAVRQSPSLVPQHVDLENHEALAPYDVPFFNDFLGVGGGFAANPFPAFYPQAPPPPGFQHITHSPAIGGPQRISRSPHGPQRPRSFPDPFMHPAIAPQSPIDGTYSLQIHPSAWHPSAAAAGPGSSAIYASGSGSGGGEQAALAGAPVPMAPAAAAAPFSSSTPLPHVIVPTSRSPAGTRVPVVVRPWDAAPTGASSCARAAGPPPPPPWAPLAPVPTPFCRCHLRAHPLVRVDDVVEWVRPDLMRMSVWFNWSPTADAEAHESWEQRRA
ncbi:hypothetical protein V8E53_014851 [Lactarius tabidus]|jgi:hypothetical protein